MRLHLEMQTERNVAAGMNPDEARYAARRQFGGIEQIKEVARDQRGWVWLELLLKNLRFASRSLLRSPGFTATALITLALCLAANLTIFAVVDAILVRSLPFPDPDRLVTILNSYPGVGHERGGSSIANYFERREAVPAFTSVALFSSDNVIVGDAGSPQRVSIARVTPEFFVTLGAPLALGRPFTDAELTYSTDNVAVLTDEFWRTHFDADSSVLGRTFFNDGLPVTVIGVLAPGFQFLSNNAQFFRPMSHAPEMRLPPARHASSGLMIARLAAGASLTLAQNQLDTVEARLAPDDPQKGQWLRWGYHTIVRSLHADHVREVRPVLLLVQTGAFLLLLIGLVNLANLLLVRAGARAHEMAVRRALGATRRHVVAQLLTEILLLVMSGGTLGLIFAVFGVRAIALLGIDRLPLGASVVLDGQTAGIAFAVTLATGGLLALPRWCGSPCDHASTPLSTFNRAAQPLAVHRNFCGMDSLWFRSPSRSCCSLVPACSVSV